MDAVPDINHYTSFMFGTIAKQVDKCVRFWSAGLNVVPFLALEYAEASMNNDEPLGTVPAGLQAAPFVTNNISKVAQKIDRVIPFGQFGDVSSSSRYIAAENTLKKQIPSIRRVVGVSFGGSVA